MSDILNKHADTIDVEEIIERVKELDRQDERTEEEEDEYTLLNGTLEQLRDYGGDVKYQGDWYPQSLISEDYFEEYARELANDIGSLPDTWPYRCIDWEQAAKELKYDYSALQIEDRTFYYR